MEEDKVIRYSMGTTGTRSGGTAAQVSAFRRLVRDKMPDAFRHGSCRGWDVQAARIVREELPACRIVAYPGPDGDLCREDSGVDDEVRLGKTHFARNRDIVDDSHVMTAAPVGPERQPTGGTWYTIGYASRAGKTCLVIVPDGQVEVHLPRG